MSHKIEQLPATLLPPTSGTAPRPAAGQPFAEVAARVAQQQSDAQIGQALQQELAARLARLPAGAPAVQALLPELVSGQRRLALLREALSRAGRVPTAREVGALRQVEAEWQAVEAEMWSNRELSMAELLALQARLYQVTQHIEVLSKVVDQVTGGIKTVLNTNV